MLFLYYIISKGAIVMGNMSCGHLEMMMNDIPLVPNIIVSSQIFFHNHLSLQIYHTFFTLGRWLKTSCDTNRSTI